MQPQIPIVAISWLEACQQADAQVSITTFLYNNGMSCFDLFTWHIPLYKHVINDIMLVCRLTIHLIA